MVRGWQSGSVFVDGSRMAVGRELGQVQALSPMSGCCTEPRVPDWWSDIGRDIARYTGMEKLQTPMTILAVERSSVIGCTW